jgi:3-deoxy-D-manno-octulosonic acid (KDO) 8-phosphate synthase
MEIHPDPKSARCDGENSLPLSDLEETLAILKKIEEALWTA